jgi:anti-sigma regulatory factor (Ser/Thr protein kinase)
MHSALLYRDERDYLDGTLGFVEEGLTAGEPVQVMVPPVRLRLLRDALGTAAERVSWQDITGTGRNPSRLLPAALLPFVDDHPGQRVRIVGEPVWPGRSAAEHDACTLHEALINQALARRWVNLLCPYDTGTLDQPVLADARATHPVLVTSGRWSRSGDYAPERVLADHHRRRPAPPEDAAELTVHDPRALSEARGFAAVRARRLGLPAERVMDLEMAVSEMVSNSIVHGGGEGTLRIWSEGDHVVCEVWDAGRLTDPLAGRRPAGAEQSQGRGLLLVNHLVDLLCTYAGPTGTAFRAHLGRT